jgi:hypothetical protein
MVPVTTMPAAQTLERRDYVANDKHKDVLN